jgi:hypothetical protein
LTIEQELTWVAHGLGQIVHLDPFSHLVFHIGRLQTKVLDVGESTRGNQKAFALQVNIPVTLGGHGNLHERQFLRIVRPRTERFYLGGGSGYKPNTAFLQFFLQELRRIAVAVLRLEQRLAPL